MIRNLSRQGMRRGGHHRKEIWDLCVYEGLPVPALLNYHGMEGISCVISLTLGISRAVKILFVSAETMLHFLSC